MNVWLTTFWGHIGIALLTAIPVLVAFFGKSSPIPIPPEIDENESFTEIGKNRLKRNFNGITGSLAFWKKEARKHRYFYYYAAIWGVLISILVPVLIQATADLNASEPALLITSLSIHGSSLIGLSKALRTGKNFKAYRKGESAVYDAFRKLMDNPAFYRPDENQQLEKYFDTIEAIRKRVRKKELAYNSLSDA